MARFILRLMWGIRESARALGGAFGRGNYEGKLGSPENLAAGQ